MAGNKKSVNLLPENLRTTKNAKFLSSTIDPLISSPELERIDGYVGSKLTPNYNPNFDFYLKSSSTLRQNYALEPALVFKNNINEISDVVGYDDIINELTNQGANTENLSSLFQSKYYSYDPLIDWDKLINFSSYYWLPTGPDTILINKPLLDVEFEIVGNSSYTMPNGYALSNGMKIKFLNDVIPSSYADKEFIVEGVGDSIKLIHFKLLEADQNIAGVYNERFDNGPFDKYPFDGDRKIALYPEYITINRASGDLNPWTRYNRWFHKSIIELTAKINNQTPSFEFNLKAKRPIIEFKPNLQLYNFGRRGIKNVDLFDSTTTDAFAIVDGSYGYYVDGILLEQGHRIIFNADTDDNVRGKIYKVEVNFSGESPIINLVPAEDSNPNNLDSVSVNLGNTYFGKTFHYNSTDKTWSYSQQHEKLNEPPLFDLFNNDGISYTEIADKNNFIGNKIFGYDVGTGIPDPVLGFPLKSQNSVGIGSYVFKNYFMTGVISKTVDQKSQEISTGVTFIKVNNPDNTETLLNVWNKSSQIFKSPVIENQVIDQTTSTVTIQSITNPIFSSVNVYVNNVKKEAIITTGSNIVSFASGTILQPNDVVTIKLVTDENVNDKGYYQPTLSLTNNPLNGPISDLTFSELSDHLRSMIEKVSNFKGTFPGDSNLRDLYDYAKYGSRLIINSNPIAFTQFFLGKKSHNVVDALRSASRHYNQFKMNLLQLAVSITDQLDPIEALEEILKVINKGKDSNSPYYRSDMLGYGPSKIVKNITVTNAAQTEYYTGRDFDPTKLSFESLVVYLNNDLLVYGQDYSIDVVDQKIDITADLDVDDVISIVYHDNTQGCYIPPTPTKLGLYPKFTPVKFLDDTFTSGPVYMIRGHDGSLIKAYNDYRDDIILEFEKRVYNNIKVSYNSQIFDITETLPGAFRSNYFSKVVNDILEQDFVSWAGQYSVDFVTNSTFDESNEFTWNFSGSIDTVTGQPVSGTWRNLFRYFYDTDRPHTHPWEMLGHSEKPDWWDTHYSWSAGPKRTSLIQAIILGITDEPPSVKTNPVYARPQFGLIVPVDVSGNLIDPTTFLVTENPYTNRSQSWKFGDMSPAETAWRHSSSYPFSLNIAAAISRSLDYLSSMFDVSRLSLNQLNQITYREDDLYLNLRKLIIDDQEQIAGYGVYICENGKQKYQNYLEMLSQDLSFVDFNLFHKLGGFSSKEKLQINIDSIDPISRSPGVILPPEDYTLLLNVSNPIKDVNISGIIIQRSNGKFLIKGYDKVKPYFNILYPIVSAVSGTMTVGGVSEEFSEWSGSTGGTDKNLTAVDLTTANSVTTRYYKQGQIVRYNGIFYRVKISHNAQDTFNPALFQQLPSLPVKGGASAQLPQKYSSEVTVIPYGTELSTIQEVFDIILGYGAWLESQGFVFDFFNTELNEVINWKFSAKEFLYWTTQNWSDNNLITLSAFSEYLKFESNDSVVDNVVSNEYGYGLLKADGMPYPLDKFNFSREDGSCTIQTLDPYEGIFFASIRTVQKEHAIIINNTTIFNDTIFDIESGYKQQRIKLSGFRTKNWNGDFFSPGFVYDSVNITEWAPFKSYNAGNVVRYKGLYYQAIGNIESSGTFDFNQWAILTSKPYSQLIPNFDYKIKQFEDFYSLDIDNFDYAQQQLAQHLTGYTPRTYLNNIFSNPISQYKFYQGFIKEKGTKKSIDKLTKAKNYGNQGTIDINEEWAFRVGDYGSYSSYNEIEFNLKEGDGLENPYIVKFVDTIPDDKNPLISYVSPNDLLIVPDVYKTTSTFSTYDGTFDDTNFELLNAGYVRFDDVTATAYNKNSILDIANNFNINNKDTIWTGFLENGSWTVYRYAKQKVGIVGVFVSSPSIDITFVTDRQHKLKVGEIVSVSRFNEQVNGVYIVKAIPSLTQFSVESTLSTIVNEELLAPGILYKFESARVDHIDNLSTSINLTNLQNGDKIWVDKDIDDKWKVYQKINNYSSDEYNTSDIYGDQRFGFKVYASDSSPLVIVSSPGKKEINDTSYGRITVFQNINNILERQYDYSLNTGTSVYCDPNLITEFGYSIAYDENKKLFVVGAPSASNIRAPLSTGTVILSTGTGTIKSFANEGLVKVSAKNLTLSKDETQFILVNPNAASSATAVNSRFGHSIYISQPVSTTSTTMLVSAPGTSNYPGAGSVYAYWISTATNTLTNSIVSVNPYKFVIASTSSITLNSGSRWGHKISGNRQGTKIAISAPGYQATTSNKIGIVQIFDNTLTWTQSILSPLTTGEAFGDDIVMSNSGNVLVISSVNAVTETRAKGKVFVYHLNSNNSYQLSKIIDNPVDEVDLKFGYSLSISNNESIISVSALGTNRSKRTEFFEDGTTFDSKSTTFISSIPDSGTVYIFEKLGNQFVYSSELNDADILQGSRYGMSVAVTDNSVYVGSPMFSSVDLYTNILPDNSKLYQFNKIDQTFNGYKILRNQESTVENEKIKRIVLIDSSKEEVVEYLDVIDPIKGKISGLAEQELKYKVASDPAVYSIGLSINIVDDTTNWLDDHVGELWWDLSTAKFVWYEQGDDIYRKNNWGRLFPGSSIDVYEWVKSDLLPSEWAAQADSNEGLTNGISGQPKYPDNSVVSVKQVYNTITGSLENVYYYWVKNKALLPNIKNRRISALQVASLIADPIANGIKFAEIISSNSLALANIQSMLVGDRINANIVIDKINNDIPKHTEWLLLQEGNPNSVPNKLLEKKLIDSLLGHDSFGVSVPDPTLSYRSKYGLGIRPQQTLFKDRFEALRNVVEFSNNILIQNNITGNYSFENLNKQEEIPDLASGEYDYIVNSENDLSSIDTTNFRRARLECFVFNGSIRAVNIIDSGFGYINPPKVSIISETGTDGEIELILNANGSVESGRIISSGKNYVTAPELSVRPHTVIIRSDARSNNKWSKNEFNYTSTSEENNWIKVKTQTYNTPLYWDYVDWSTPSFNKFKNLAYSVDTIFEALSINNINSGDYVKVKNGGNGYYIILEKVAEGQVGNFSSEYNIVYIEKGTIQINESIWNYSLGKYAYDLLTFDETLYDQIPDLEIYYILLALKEDIFVGPLKVYWNLLFFTAVRYAMSEQKLLDWAFKTSFINIKNNVGTLDQRPVYKLDSDSYFEEYIKEVKPYHTKIRNYTSAYGSLEQAPAYITDFDLPSYYNYSTNEYETINITSDVFKTTFTITNTLTNVDPWKSWADNYTYEVKEILIAEPGKGYNQIPTVTISAPTLPSGTTATANAYLRNGGIYQIVVTNPGSGYISQPTVTITGGGNVTTTATASVVLGNNTIRKNQIGIKFDRYKVKNEISNETITDTFVCDGNTVNFDLSWVSNYEKETLVPRLDGQIVLATDYTLVFSGNINKKCTFRFLNYVPKEGQIFKVSYNKNINNFDAVERINYYYRPTGSMPTELSSLMTGVTYNNTIYQGLPFNYAVKWDSYNNLYGDFVWDELVNQYAFAEVISTASVGTSTLYLNTTTDIVTGQEISVISSSSSKVRKGTTVASVSSLTNSIVITTPSYQILTAKSTGTSIGSDIIVRTAKPFNSTILVDDLITLTGITPVEFNGQYRVKKVDSNDTFIVTATSVLSGSTVTSLTSASATIISVIEEIKPASVLIDRIINTVTNVTSSSIAVLSNYKKIAKLSVSVNSSPITTSTATTPYYVLAINTLTNRSQITVNGLTTTTNVIDVQVFANPKIEFWKTNTLANKIDTALIGGEWSGTNFVGALGVNPNDLIVNGEKFLSTNVGYGPEELIPGYTLDSIGINVYTKSKKSNALIMTGALPGYTNTTTFAFSIEPEPKPFGLMVHSSDRIFDRIDNDTFTTSNQYSLTGPEITFAPQNSLRRIGYGMITSGGENLLDSKFISVSNTTTVLVESLSSIIDVNSAYVLVNGQTLSPITTTSNYGYILESVGDHNNRACVKIYNLSTATNNIQVWFFNAYFDQFNRVHEEFFTVTSTSSLTLSVPPSNIQPASAQAIVEVGSIGSETRRRIMPPWVSYYQVNNNQVTFNIDNKNNRPTDYYTTSQVKVYVNGIESNYGLDYVVTTTNSTVTFNPDILQTGDAVAIMALKDYDYIISGNTLTFASTVTNSIVKVITFTNHDDLLIQTEKFNPIPINRYTLTREVLADDYVWVYVNGIPLIHRYDFEILRDRRTVQFYEWVNTDSNDTIVITTFVAPSSNNTIVGYRVFKDMFDRSTYRRLSKQYSTFLTKELKPLDTEIHVNNSDNLITPDPLLNKPGVVIIDGERIEYFEKSGNILRHLRRSTMGTGPARVSQVGTTVIDQSIHETVPYLDKTYIQNILTTNTTTYTISTTSSTSTGDGIVLSSGISAVDQIEVYYGGRQLRKTSLLTHDYTVSYEVTNASLKTLPPEFSVNTSTQELILNLSSSISTGTQITVVQKKGSIWTGTESLLTSDVVQAKFLRLKPAVLPDVYYYGGNRYLLDNSYYTFTDENDSPLEE